MKRRTFLGRVAAAAGVLVTGAKAVAALPEARYTPTVAQALGITEKRLAEDFEAVRFYDEKPVAFTQEDIDKMVAAIDKLIAK